VRIVLPTRGTAAESTHIASVQAGKSRFLSQLAVLAALLVCVVACSSRSGLERSGPGTTSSTAGPGESQYPARVVLFGDSLSGEAYPYYTTLVKATGQNVLAFDSLGGTATCDWLPTMRRVEATVHPTAVELQFSGNALTPCMEGFKTGTPAYYSKFRADTEAAINIFVPSGAHVYLIGAPITRSEQADPNWHDTLNREYAQIVYSDPVHLTYVDAGAAVETPSHTFAQTLPCLPVESCTGPLVDGVPSNVVRSPDGTHFCPVRSTTRAGAIDACPSYSSGAFRYAVAMVVALVTST
jgi:hypothetical protein